MMRSDQSDYMPACRSDNENSCSNCTLAYDCRSKMRGGLPVSWPVIAVVVVGIFALGRAVVGF